MKIGANSSKIVLIYFLFNMIIFWLPKVSVYRDNQGISIVKEVEDLVTGTINLNKADDWDASIINADWEKKPRYTYNRYK